MNIVERVDDLVTIRHALVSVWDKSGLDLLVPGLIEVIPDLRIMSTGGTYTTIARAGTHLTRVDDYVGQPETQGGLVKTLDFRIYLGLLTETYNSAHQADLHCTGAVSIDLVVANLYPFEDAVAQEGATAEHARAYIDIGGPCMIRAAAKNYLHVAAVVDSADYEWLVGAVRAGDGCLDLAQRFHLARKAFARTAAYERAISRHFGAWGPEAHPGTSRAKLRRLDTTSGGYRPTAVP